MLENNTLTHFIVYALNYNDHIYAIYIVVIFILIIVIMLLLFENKGGTGQ